MGNDPGQHTLWSMPGDGVLARQGSLVLLVSIDDHEFADSLLELLVRVSEKGGDGRALADAISAQIEGHRSWGGLETGPSVVSFGPVSSGSVSFGPASSGSVSSGPAGGGLAFAVSGTACVEFSTSHGTDLLTAGEPSMVLTSTVGIGVQSVRAALDRDGPAEETDRFSRLDSGTTRAGGLSWYSAPPAYSAQPDKADRADWADWAAGAGDTGSSPTGPLPEEPVPASSTLVGIVVPPPQPAPAPEYAAPEYAAAETYPAAGAPDHGGVPIVLGIYCENGHFTDPDTRWCVICGTDTSRRSADPQPGPRPPLGVLILDDGTTLTVDGDYVIGRSPGRDQSVSAGAARPVRVTDGESTVSRVHASLHLDGWRVLLTDLGSANGTHIQQLGAQIAQRLEPQVPVQIQPGTRFFVGSPCLRYEAAGPA